MGQFCILASQFFRDLLDASTRSTYNTATKFHTKLCTGIKVHQIPAAHLSFSDISVDSHNNTSLIQAFKKRSLTG